MPKARVDSQTTRRAQSRLSCAGELRIGISGWPYAEELTTDIVYCRLHGAEQLYVSGYSDSALEECAERLRRWRRGRSVFIYFDNDAKVHAPFDAQRLAKLLKT